MQSHPEGVLYFRSLHASEIRDGLELCWSLLTYIHCKPSVSGYCPNLNESLKRVWPEQDFFRSKSWDSELKFLSFLFVDSSTVQWAVWISHQKNKFEAKTLLSLLIMWAFLSNQIKIMSAAQNRQTFSSQSQSGSFIWCHCSPLWQLFCVLVRTMSYSLGDVKWHNWKQFTTGLWWS